MNPINLILDKLKPIHKNSLINQKNISIETADIYHDKINRLNKICFVVRYDEEQGAGKTKPYTSVSSLFYLFAINIGHESNEITVHLVRAISEVEKTTRYKLNVFVNKYNEEAYIFFSSRKKSMGLFFSLQHPNEEFNIAVDYEFKGFSCINTPEQFSVDTLSPDKGVWNVYFSGNKILLCDKTEVFLKNVINSPQSINDSYNQSNQLEKSKPKRTTHLGVTTYCDDDTAMIDSNLDKFLQNEFKEFSEMSRKSTNNLQINNQIKTFLEKINKYEFLQIYHSITKILHCIVDDPTLNVDNINKESIKAELVIIEYLRQKEKNLEDFLDFLKFFRIFEHVDKNQTIFLKFLELREKLIVAIKLREFENNVVDRMDRVRVSHIKNSGSSSMINLKDEKYYFIANNFFNSVYPGLRENPLLKPLLNERPFYKQMIFSKISEIHIFLETIHDNFLTFIEDNKKQGEEKVILSYILVTLFNIILNSVRLHKEKFFQENNFESDLNSSISYMRENSQMLWLLNPEYLKSFEVYLNIFLEYNSIQISTSTQNEIFSYSDNLLYLFELFHKVNFSPHSQKNYQNSRKDILSKVIKLNSEKSLVLAKKYKDFYSITLLCYKENWLNELKETMKEFREDETIICYILKLYLLFESESIRENLNSQKSSEFSFFENFEEYSEEIEKICKKYPKLNFHYEIFKKSKNSNDHEEINLNLETFARSVVKKENLNIYLKIAKIFNILNECNNKDLTKRLEQEGKFSENKNETNASEINFVLLINYLNSSLNLSSFNTDDNNNIFEEFPKFLKNFIQSKSTNLVDANNSGLLRFTIASQILKLAKEIKYKFQDNLGELTRVKYF